MSVPTGNHILEAHHQLQHEEATSIVRSTATLRHLTHVVYSVHGLALHTHTHLLTLDVADAISEEESLLHARAENETDTEEEGIEQEPDASSSDGAKAKGVTHGAKAHNGGTHISINVAAKGRLESLSSAQRRNSNARHDESGSDVDGDAGASHAHAAQHQSKDSALSRKLSKHAEKQEALELAKARSLERRAADQAKVRTLLLPPYT
jgi:hypothetical protein